MKKIVTGLAFGVLTPNVIIADDIERPNSIDSRVFDGFYADAEIGRAFLKNKGHVKTTNVTDPKNSTDIASIGDIQTSSANHTEQKIISNGFYVGIGVGG